jgi:hypothetical protein
VIGPAVAEPLLRAVRVGGVASAAAVVAGCAVAMACFAAGMWRVSTAPVDALLLFVAGLHGGAGVWAATYFGVARRVVRMRATPEGVEIADGGASSRKKRIRLLPWSDVDGLELVPPPPARPRWARVVPLRGEPLPGADRVGFPAEFDAFLAVAEPHLRDRDPRTAALSAAGADDDAKYRRRFEAGLLLAALMYGALKLMDYGDRPTREVLLHLLGLGAVSAALAFRLVRHLRQERDATPPLSGPGDGALPRGARPDPGGDA